MTKALGDNNFHFSDQTFDLPQRLQTLIDNAFREEQDCILFKDYDYFGPGLLLTDYDKTSFECFLNETNLYSYVPDSTTDLETLRIGIEFCKRLYQKLKMIFKNNFRVILSLEQSTSGKQEISSPGGCIIKFHTIRKLSDDKFRMDNLDSMTNEAIMILE